LVSGTVIVIQRAPAAPNGATAWGGNLNSLQDPQAYLPQPMVSTTQPNYGAISPTFLPIQPTPLPGDTAGGSDTNLADLLAQLSAPLQPAADSTTTTPDSALAYDFIPRGLIATTTPGKKRTPQQQALYEYGNEIGTYIQAYEARSGNVPQILRDQIEDRTDPQKGNAVKDVGSSLIYIGTQMERMDSVPADVADTHAALARSYREMGAKLQQVPDAKGDQAFIAAIEAYNASADAFSRTFVSLADFFVLSGVQFAPSDPGNVFTFSSGGGL
jgi:hypothetical protein